MKLMNRRRSPGTRKLIETDYRYVIYYRVVDR